MERVRLLEKKYKKIKEQMNSIGEENIADTFPYFDLIDQVLADNSSIELHYIIDCHSVDEVAVVSSRSESPYSNLGQIQDTDVQTEEMPQEVAESLPRLNIKGNL